MIELFVVGNRLTDNQDFLSSWYRWSESCQQAVPYGLTEAQQRVFILSCILRQLSIHCVLGTFPDGLCLQNRYFPNFVAMLAPETESVCQAQYPRDGQGCLKRLLNIQDVASCMLKRSGLTLINNLVNQTAMADAVSKLSSARLSDVVKRFWKANVNDFIGNLSNRLPAQYAYIRAEVDARALRTDG